VNFWRGLRKPIRSGVSRETPSGVNRALEQLRLQCGEWGLELKESKLRLLDLYAGLLANYSLANVIGVRDVEKILLEHILDSLSCLTVEYLRSANSTVDIGTGGGLPGVPLSIVCPDLQVTLVEATKKKVNFLGYVKEALQLSNLEVLQARAEDVGQIPAFREAFDLATVRALAELAVVIEYCAPLVRKGGHIVSMKGRLEDEESAAGLKACSQLGVELHEVRPVQYHPSLPQKERRLVVLNKTDITPNSFPRRPGLAKKRPLGM
ncbi:MAG: 16S rRNA (guanine(527)-N(7))-methyltransferase RsmG, partial [Actinobacteria bacterium]|nr:16S rRNA (guanine(527)-N(7))-methyltransferase RsmG [Actinomycetota bacterium]